MAHRDGVDRRRYPRVKARIPVEVHSVASPAPSRAVTEEVSLCGCYVETIFTLDVGAKVSLTLWLNDQRLHATAVVVTRYPQVGNGFDFTEMQPEDRLKLNDFIAACERGSEV
jgi:c-di-GMP-binding flagellar brake protein YcgR